MSKQCRNCGADLPEDASFCPRCAQSQIERREVKPPRLWRKKALITAGCALVLAAAIFYVVNYPASVSAAATTRQLPIYSVERSQKVCAISFDAAWGDAKVRQFSC